MSPSSRLQLVTNEAGRLASALPSSVLHTLAEAIPSCDPADWPWSKTRIAAGISQPHYRSLAASFLDAWQSEAKIVSPEAVAAALLMAAHSEQAHQHQQSVELAWTGPDVGVIPLRRTEQAILQVLDAAQERITLASYAVFRIPDILYRQGTK